MSGPTCYDELIDSRRTQGKASPALRLDAGTKKPLKLSGSDGILLPEGEQVRKIPQLARSSRGGQIYVPKFLYGV
jgi:hypothetical protein